MDLFLIISGSEQSEIPIQITINLSIIFFNLAETYIEKYLMTLNKWIPIFSSTSQTLSGEGPSNVSVPRPFLEFLKC